MRISDWSSDVCSSDLPVAVGARRTAGQIARVIHRAESAARAVAFAAVGDVPHQIGPAVPRGILGGIGLEGAGLQVEPLPTAEGETPVVGKVHRTAPVTDAHRGLTHDIDKNGKAAGRE